MRNLSFMYTKQQYIDGTKTQTTRKSKNLSIGERFTGVEKCQGIPKGGHVVRLGPAIVEKIEPFFLSYFSYTPENCAAEGFPGMTSEEFVRNVIIKQCKIKLGQLVYRITFRKIPE